MKDLVLGKYILFLILPGLILLGWQAKLIPYTEPVSASVSISPTPTPTSENMGQAILDENEEGLVFEDDYTEIEEIAEEIFNDDAELMLAIGKAESGLNPEKCHIDEKEYSCGWLQINLRAHFEKVPGYTFEEKAEYLKNPRNNAITGRFIKATSGLNAWSVYKSGVYKKFIE